MGSQSTAGRHTETIRNSNFTGLRDDGQDRPRRCPIRTSKMRAISNASASPYHSLLCSQDLNMGISPPFLCILAVGTCKNRDGLGPADQHSRYQMAACAQRTGFGDCCRRQGCPHHACNLLSGGGCWSVLPSPRACACCSGWSHSFADPQSRVSCCSPRACKTLRSESAAWSVHRVSTSIATNSSALRISPQRSSSPSRRGCASRGLRK